MKRPVAGSGSRNDGGGELPPMAPEVVASGDAPILFRPIHEQKADFFTFFSYVGFFLLCP